MSAAGFWILCAGLALAASCGASLQGDPASALYPAFEPPARTYNYASCLLQSAGGIRHIWYCANRTPGEVTDVLCHREGHRSGAGWVWGEEQVALTPATQRTMWDSRHVCDPEVVAGRFRYGGRTWTYAMLYLGCDAERSTHNQVGVAFSNSLGGPWTRYPEPLIRYTSAPDSGVVDRHLTWPVYRYWGVGQPSAISLDHRGRLLIFYSRGEEVWGETMVEVDLSDMDRGPVIGKAIPAPTEGLLDDGGRPSPGMVNVSVALDERNDTLYAVGDGPLRADSRLPGFISARVRLASIRWSELRRGSGVWRELGTLDVRRTGWPRNHNAALLRDAWGRLPDRRRLTVALSVSMAYDVLPPDFGWLWTYRIAIVDFPLPATASARAR